MANPQVNDLLELRVSARFQHVYSLRSGVRGDYLLRGQLYDFREISGNGLAARVAFEFELRDSRTGRAVWSRSYSHDEPVNGKDVLAVVAAIDRNVQTGIAEIMGDLERYFSAQAGAAAAAH